MKTLLTGALLLFSLSTASVNAVAQNTVPAYAASNGIASKLIIRGEFKDIKVNELRSQRRNGLLTVQADVANLDSSDSRVYYRFRWIDSSGMQVGDGETWKPLIILGQQSQLIQGMAYGPQAIDFRIEMSSESR